MTQIPHPRCRYPECDCIKGGTRCRVAEDARIDAEIHGRELDEKYCSHCGLGERSVDQCETGYCINGDVSMIDPLKPLEKRHDAS